jgi:hypothetical protein
MTFTKTDSEPLTADSEGFNIGNLPVLSTVAPPPIMQKYTKCHGWGWRNKCSSPLNGGAKHNFFAIFTLLFLSQVLISSEHASAAEDVNT